MKANSTISPLTYTDEGVTKLPVIISIPHGGVNVPHELRDRVCLNPDDVLKDSDSRGSASRSCACAKSAGKI